jgi:hypothetical protein
MIELNWTEVDGVATVWADVPGPLRAGLMFRTGRADETLITSGHTHLIEHMTLTAMNASMQTSNGFVGGINTGFVTIGTPQDVAAFFQGICNSLRTLPANRLEAEKQILLAESASRRYDIRTSLLTNRYGSTGYGLIGMNELGVRGATIQQLEQRRASSFISENAVLWLSGPPPADLKLDLPSGNKQPLPTLTAFDKDFPTWVTDEACGGIAASATVPRVAASSLFLTIAQKRLQDHLRTQQAVSYSPMVFYEPLDAKTAHVILFADSDQNHRSELTKGFGEIYEKLAEFSEAELDTAKKQYLEYTIGALAPPVADRAFFEVQRAALDWLMGHNFESMEQILAEAQQVTLADMAEFVHNLQHTTMFALPANIKLHSWMGKQKPFSIVPAVNGKEALNMDAPVNSQRLIYGKDGVSIKWSTGSSITVRYAELAAVLRFDDGGLSLISSNAASMNIEPTLWRNGATVCREICEHIPAHLLIEQGVRSTDRIPKPSTTPWQRFRASLKL